jgi:hypothetical protein
VSDTAPRPPSSLGEQGRALWDSVIPQFELRPDELRILIDACREADLIERLHEALLNAPLVTRGSMGQEVASPFVSELRQHRATLSQLLSKIKIPDTPGTAARRKAKTSENARLAARARWGTGAGA